MASRWDEVKRIPIDEVAQQLNVSLSRRAGMRCPFPDHKDKNPSFSIDRKKNLCFCHGCGRGGSVIDFASIMTGKSSSEVVSWLSQSIRQPKTNSRRFSRIAPAEGSEAEDPQFIASPAIFDHFASLKAHGYTFQSVPEVWVFNAGSLGKFAVAVCYDFLDLERVAMYRLGIQHLFILAYNTDLPTFDHAAEALSRMIFCNVVVCNTGSHGGSLAVSPYSGVGKRVIYRHIGSPLSTGQTVSLPVADLVLAQTNMWPEGRAREFKSLPPGAGVVHLLTPHTETI